MTVIISVVGRKGGQGKTAMSKNLAAGAALAGLRTVLIDADSQHNAYDGLGINVPAYDGLKELVQNDNAEWQDLLLSVPERFTGVLCPAFHVLPTADGQREIEEDENTPTLLYRRFQELHDYIDVAIVDTSPSISQVHVALYYASTALLLPVMCDIDSALSPEKTINYLASAGTAGAFDGYPAASVLGIVPNALDNRELVQIANSGFIRGRYHDRYHVFETLSEKSVWKQAAQNRMSIYAMTQSKDPAERRPARAALKEFQPIMQAVLDMVKVTVS